MTSIALAYASINKKINSVEIETVNWKKISLVLFFAMAALAVFYVFEINNLTTGSYQIKSYQKQINSIEAENKLLEMEYAQANFLEGVRQSVQQYGFERIENIKYLHIASSSLAQAK